MQSADTIEVKVCSRAEIRRKLVAYLPLVIASFVGYTVILMGIAIYFLKDMPKGRDAAPGVLVCVVCVVFVGCYMHAKWTISKLASYRLTVQGDTLTVRCHFWGRERYYALRDIKYIAFGQIPNFFDKILSHVNSHAAMMKDIKGGRMLIVDKNDRRKVFDLLDKAFEESSLAEFIAELNTRGVDVRTSF